MSRWVIDASVIVKLVYEEEGSREARRLIERLCLKRAPMHVPDHLFAELASVGHRKILCGEGTEREAGILLEVVGGLPFVPWSCRGMAGAALEISLALGVSPYDAFYLAVAEHVDGKLLTADRRLADALSGTAFAGRIEILGAR